jgi:mannitol operon repressor
MTTYRSDLNEYKWEVFFDEFNNESPRAAVIVSCAFLDTLLRDLIATHLVNNKAVIDELLGSEKKADRPLSSFGARITTAYLLGLIKEEQYQDLKHIKTIRNKFAHEIHGFSFDNEEIIKLCNLLQSPKILEGFPIMENQDHRIKYITAVSLLLMQLGLNILEAQKERRILS